MSHYSRLPYISNIKNRNGGRYLTRVHLTPFAWWPAKWDRFYLHILHEPDEGVLGHKITPHNHPWAFKTIVLYGGYEEVFVNSWKKAITVSSLQKRNVKPSFKNLVEFFSPWSSDQSRLLGFTHQITKLNKKISVTFLRRGPRVNIWGFYVPSFNILEVHSLRKGAEQFLFPGDCLLHFKTFAEIQGRDESEVENYY